MKYTISINQKALNELAPKLDLIHYAILDYLYFICSSVSEKIAKQRLHDSSGSWTWIDYSHLMSEMPALKIKTASAITPRIQAIEKAGFIRTMKGHRFRLYAQLLPKIDSVFVETKASVRSNESYQGIQRSLKRKDNNTNNNTNNQSVILKLKEWNSNQTSPIPDFKAEFVVNKHGPEKITRLIKKYGQENNGFRALLFELKYGT